MSFISEYKSSLKGMEAEEIFDLIIYRPIAYIYVKATYSLNITPNQVSVVALICGILAGVFFSFGSLESNITGAFLYFLCNVLDCADGQIARLKHNGTKVGRIIDGSIDYVVSIAVFVGIAIGLPKSYYNENVILYGAELLNMNIYLYVWLATVIAGVSSAFHSFFFDYYRNKFMLIVYNKVTSPEKEIQEFEEEKKRLSAEKKGGLDILLITVYLVYTRLQLKLHRPKKVSVNPAAPGEIDQRAYYRKNKILLRLWSFIGSTSHITMCIIFASLNRLELFLLICIIPMNIFMLFIFILQKRSNTLLKI